ncbi:acyl-CoA dehydrogenase family protein [Comamonas antarctica]|uniref:acyl-CoA dehydrogenase family protein n=1 Tax=Comamonas antarctica TaxID=2743470 RepID=UPI0028E87869|nr:acyl-CoA dehydrogenase family protein [Comamonas antarctica]
MDLEYKPEDLQFRDEVRQFFKDHLPSELSEKVRKRRHMQREDAVRWHKILAEKGWIAPGWPVKYGGTGWSSMQRHIWAEEYAKAYAPPTLSFGLNLLAPVLLGFASEEQKQHFLPRIYHAEDWWCQGYSEPGAGSDLASLNTRAVREGDFYIVNGQKTWTTLGQHADWIFCLVRTSTEGTKQTGISFLLIDMKTPGITVRPIITMDETHEVNEVFFDNVKVPVANLVGEENKGWTYAKYLLGHERTGIAAIGNSKRELKVLKRLALSKRLDGAPLLQDPQFAARVADIEIELMALEMTALALVADGASSKIGPEASMLKVKGTEISQAISEMLLEASGPAGLAFDPDYLHNRKDSSDSGEDALAALAPHYFNLRKITIFGGSNEVQRNVISKMILGL